MSAPIDWCPHGYSRRSCESCAEVAALLAQVRDLKARVKKLEEALLKHCKSTVSIPCSMCHDSTWDHECNDREEPCPHCAALATKEET